MAESGEGTMARSRYAMLQLDEIEGVRAPAFQSPHFKEFVVDFNGTGRTVADINHALLARGIFGGKDLSGEFPESGECALYCVTEVHTKDDIDRLVETLREVVA
jgi:glycine dehydrogenase subunit 1